MNIRFLVVIAIVVLTVTGCGNSDAMINGNNSDQTEVVVKTPILKAPPNLSVTVDDIEVNLAKGTYSWSYPNGDGTSTAIEADSAAPPDLVKSLNQVDVTSESKIKLDFEKDPLSYQVRIWKTDYTTTNVNKESYGLSEHKGLLVYEVLANWQEGTATYAFLLNNE